MSSMSTVQDFIARQPVYNQRRRYLHPILNWLVKHLCNLDVKGLENIPRTGPAILMMNHISFIDPIILTAIIRERYVISMAKSEAADYWLPRMAIRLWGNFLINRNEVDRHALTNAIELLKSGQLVLIAPEGTRNPHGLGAAKDGIAYIAQKADALIIPAALSGAQDWTKRIKRFKKPYAQINIGRPFRFRLSEEQRLNRETRTAMMREAMYQIAMAIPDEYAQWRGLYSDLTCATSQFIEHA